jgi:hypothetical protein
VANGSDGFIVPRVGLKKVPSGLYVVVGVACSIKDMPIGRGFLFKQVIETQEDFLTLPLMPTKQKIEFISHMPLKISPRLLMKIPRLSMKLLSCN